MKLLTPVRIGALTLPNRVVMAPLTRNRAGPGNVPHELNARYYAQRATAGLIISEASQVSEQGIGYPATPGIHSPEQVEGWRLVTRAVHDAGGRIFLQLWHCGRISHSSWQKPGELPVAPSAIAARGMAFTATGQQPLETPRALTTEELPLIVAQYVAGARHALDAGFDGVEVHCANGYLLDQFLRDGSNQRTDGYGGTPEKRCRFPFEVVRAVAGVVGADRTGVRISPNSSFNDMSDSCPEVTFGQFAALLNPLRLAYLHVLQPDPADPGLQGEGVPVRFFRKQWAGPLMANWGLTPESAEAGVSAGEYDLCSFGKAFIANPDLVERIRRQAPLNPFDVKTFYGGGAEGYTDYPTL